MTNYTQTPEGAIVTIVDGDPSAWAADLLRKVSLLRAAGKKAIIWVDPDLPVVLVFAQEPAGRVMLR